MDFSQHRFEVRSVIFLYIYFNFLSDGHITFTLKEISERTLARPKNLIGHELEMLVSDKYISKFKDDLDFSIIPTYRYRITEYGLRHGFKMFSSDLSRLCDKYQVIMNLKLDALEVLPELFSDSELQVDGKEIENENWHPLPIDRDTKEFQIFTREIDENISSIEDDNGFSANFPTMRDNIVTSLRAGERLVIDSEIGRDQISALFIQPCKRILMKFSDGAIAAASKKLIDLVLSFFPGA